MSRFVRRSRLVALGILGVASLSAPAFADTAPPRSGDSCAQWTARTAPACRVAAKSARRAPVRIAMAEPRQSSVFEPLESVRTRYVSLLILGVGF